ncbi:MAG: NAD(P)/FAD-dependent oxidoreductase [Gammaproteobacteria bacterium]|jgi:thioredoxin reductase (NADPH)|nr:NAD(P)/FAD-dependent oxidoreductase [Gammaproteobacteria bacterium]MDP7271714.1 NAD(P)/FAD-dependent oxidoreductase [Gammaproteobacteria bacterium]HJP03819.1 NAD(P)/FAD-dependent oxidoreductase [Gammaproteobacteria bacterium]
MAKQTDALIVGAGPCGLFQVFELGLLGIKADILDSLPTVGGQCTELYPDKPIYDIPAVPVCTGQELIESLLEQVKPFDPTFHLGEEVTKVERQDGYFRVATSNDQEFHAKTVFIAGGVGSFQPRRFRMEGIDALEGASVHYRIREPGLFAGKKVVICGGGDSALDWALALADSVSELTLVHRREEYRAAPATVDALKKLAGDGKVRVLENAKATAFAADGEQIKSVEITVKGEDPVTLETDHLMAFFGLAPKLGPIAEWGFNIAKKAIEVDTAKFETNIPGIFAVGDINTYPGKKKLILSGFHEAALAAFAAKAVIEPGKKVNLQYTTTSPVMHERLGVDDPMKKD